MRNKSNHLKRIGVYLLAIMMVFTFLPVWQNQHMGDQNPGAVYADANATVGPYTVEYNTGTGNCSILEYSQSATTQDLVIPETLTIAGTDYQVTFIWPNAFDGNTRLTSVKIPANVMVGTEAFINCPNLKTYIFTKERTEDSTIGKYGVGYRWDDSGYHQISGVHIICPTNSDAFKYMSSSWSDDAGWQWSRPKGDAFTDPSGYTYEIDNEVGSVRSVKATGTAFSKTKTYAPGILRADNLGNPIDNDQTTMGTVTDLGVLENGVILRSDYQVDTIAYSYSADTNSIYINEKISAIEEGALGECNTTWGIVLADDHNRFYLKYGVLFDVNVTRLIRYAEALRIPEHFGDEITMEPRVTYDIPPSVKTIDYKAFATDPACVLDTIYVGNEEQGSQLKTIGPDAFSRASNLKNVVFYNKNDITIPDYPVGQPLSENADFRVYAPKGSPIYNMQKFFNVTTVANDMPSLDVQVTGSGFAYDGKPHAPTVVVKNELGETLTPEADYEIFYKTPFTSFSKDIPTKPGNYTLRISGWDKYHGSVTKSFTIVPTCKIKALWVSKHENSHVTFNWSGTPNNNLATGWDVQYRTKLIGTQYAWSKWTGSRADGKTLSKRVYLKPNYTIEFKVRHEGETAYCRSVFTTPAGGKYQSITQCQVKVTATANGATFKKGSKAATALKVGTNINGDSGNVITIKKGQSIKITPNHVYPRSNFTKYPRLYPNHAWYDVTDSTVASLTGIASTAGMKDGAVTIKGLKAGTTTIKITSCNGRGSTLTVVVK